MTEEDLAARPLPAVANPITQRKTRPEMPSLAPGQPVSARFAKRPRWYPGIIVQPNADGTYQVLYDDGDVEEAVLRKHIKAASHNDDSGGVGGAAIADAVEEDVIEAWPVAAESDGEVGRVHESHPPSLLSAPLDPSV